MRERSRCCRTDPDGYPDAYRSGRVPGPAEPAAPEDRPPGRRAAAYVLQTLAGFAVVGVKLIAVVVGLTLLAEFAHVL